MTDTERLRELERLLAAKDALIIQLADKLLIVAQHLGRLAERPDRRSA